MKRSVLQTDQYLLLSTEGGCINNEPLKRTIKSDYSPWTDPAAARFHVPMQIEK